MFCHSRTRSLAWLHVQKFIYSYQFKQKVSLEILCWYGRLLVLGPKIDIRQVERGRDIDIRKILPGRQTMCLPCQKGLRELQGELTMLPKVFPFLG